MPESLKETKKNQSTLITELNKDIISDTGDKMVIQGYINFHMRSRHPQVYATQLIPAPNYSKLIK